MEPILTSGTLCQSDRNRLRKGEFVVSLKENPLENKSAKIDIPHTLKWILRERTRTNNRYVLQQTIFHELPLVLRAHTDNTANQIMNNRVNSCRCYGS
jgi:hypothetical protein